MPIEDINFENILFSGQSFRWRKLGSGHYQGVDGSHSFDIKQSSHQFEIQTTADLSQVSSLFRLDTSWSEVSQELLEIDARLGPVLRAVSGLRPIRSSNPLEVMFSFVCTSNNHLPRITSMVEKLASMGANCSSSELRAFPSATAISSVSEEVLRKWGFGYRARSISELSHRLAETDVPNSLDYEDRRVWLMTHSGIGPKVADCICLYGFHHDEAVPIDIHMLRAMESLGYVKSSAKTLTPKAYDQAAKEFRARFGNLSGWAQLLLYYTQMKHQDIILSLK